MQLPVLAAPDRPEPGCISRYLFTVALGEGLGQAQLIVSGCQEGRLHAGFESKLAEIKAEGLDAVQLQQRLQSWIDGGSPCDQPFAKRDDRVSYAEAMQAEAEYYLRRASRPAEWTTGQPKWVVSVLPMSPVGLVEIGPPIVVVVPRQKPGLRPGVLFGLLLWAGIIAMFLATLLR